MKSQFTFGSPVSDGKYCALEKCLMQIAGNRCKVCDRNIVLSSEGVFCAHCGTFAHLTCEPETKCGICGQPLQHYERPRADPLSEAILPRALRPSKSAGGIMLLFAGLALLVIILYYCLVYSLEHMANR